MSERITHPHTHFNTESGHHLVTMTWYDLPEEGDKRMVPQFHESNITPQEALDLAQALMVRAEEALTRQVKDALLGNCRTCGNLRMVDAPKPGGRTMREYCPSCTDRGQPKKKLPTMKMWATEEAEKLR
jgi:hypothetical protein